MNIGDIIQIDGLWGFTKDPIYKVVGMNSSLVELEVYPAREGGLLSWSNKEIVGHEILDGRYKVIKD